MHHVDMPDGREYAAVERGWVHEAPAGAGDTHAWGDACIYRHAPQQIVNNALCGRAHLGHDRIIGAEMLKQHMHNFAHALTLPASAMLYKKRSSPRQSVI